MNLNNIFFLPFFFFFRGNTLDKECFLLWESLGRYCYWILAGYCFMKIAVIYQPAASVHAIRAMTTMDRFNIIWQCKEISKKYTSNVRSICKIASTGQPVYSFISSIVGFFDSSFFTPISLPSTLGSFGRLGSSVGSCFPSSLSGRSSSSSLDESLSSSSDRFSSRTPKPRFCSSDS